MALKKDCIMYNRNQCLGLMTAYCKRENCSFYKPDSEYDREAYLEEMEELGLFKRKVVKNG